MKPVRALVVVGSDDPDGAARVDTAPSGAPDADDRELRADEEFIRHPFARNRRIQLHSSQRTGNLQVH
ncbi:hypothetical protein GFS60_01289 [Rhodococcus sp. WAY2]|nr:hypothetical protein GFS60_01289 [Rhodococcus sp. WAY2]